MSEHYYTDEDRKVQLFELASALKRLIPIAIELKLDQVTEYSNALENTEKLLLNGFTHNDLTQLSVSVPDPIKRHKEWESKYLEDKNGTWQLPNWLIKLESVLQPALESAEKLKTIGFY